MPYNFAAVSFTQTNFVADFVREKSNLDVKRSLFVLEPPLGLRGNVRCLYLAHWKALSGLPISHNWTFSL